MTEKKKITIEKNGYRTVWYNGVPGCINVDVFREKSDGYELVLEWRYGKVVGNSIMGNATFWLDQAILQAKG